jgi:hypothetical protein
MDELNNIIDLAAKKYLEKYGEDAKMEEGEEQVFLLRNGTLVLSIENRELKIKLVGGEPIELDVSCSFFN